MITRFKELWTFFIADVKEMFSLYSIRLAALAAFVVMFFMNDPTALTTIVSMVPEPLRPLASVLVAFVSFALPYIARRLPQIKEPGK